MTAPGKPRPTPAELERQLAQFINTTLLGGNASVDRDTRLFEDGAMNSLRILDLIAAVEKTLGTRIPDRAVRLANFRTIATIVAAFHPDAASAASATAAAASSGLLFERRTDRARFASPIEALTQRGDVRVTAAGQVALSGLALDVLVAVDRTVSAWARALGAAEQRYPSLIDLAVLERAGQVESFPQHLTLVTPRESNAAVIPSEPKASRGIAVVPAEGPLGRDPSSLALPRAGSGDSSTSLGLTGRRALSPAVCYHAYPEWEGKTLGDEAALLTAVGRCYRFEGGNHVPLERLWDFTMREIIVLGTREQVESHRRALVRQVGELITRLELDATIESATDPFFTSGDEGRRLLQQAGALKHELLLTVDDAGRAVAAASFNHHHDFFGSRFGIALPGGGAAHSGCVAFGLERWVLGVFAQHGADADRWPPAARAWLAERRRDDSVPRRRAPDGAGA